MINLFSALSESQGERQLNVVLAWLLEAVPGATTGLLAHLGISASPLCDRSVEFQAGSTKVGFPDLVVRATAASGRRIIVVIELKLDAELTDHQRNGYRAFRAENDGDESLFVLVGPEHHRMRYLSEISHLEGAVFLSIEEFLRLLSSMGAALSLDSVANDLRDFFLPVPIAKGQLQRELDEARSLTNEERSTLSVRRLTVQVRDILADRYSSQIACGPVVWGRLKKPDPWVGFLVRSLGGGLAVVNIGFWLRKDLETGVPLFVQISDDGLASALILRGYGLVPAKYTKWAKFEWIPRLDFPDISVDGIFELTTNFFEDMAREISDRDEPKVPEIE